MMFDDFVIAYDTANDVFHPMTHVLIYHNAQLISDRPTTKRSLIESDVVAQQASCKICSSLPQCKKDLPDNIDGD